MISKVNAYFWRSIYTKRNPGEVTVPGFDSGLNGQTTFELYSGWLYALTSSRVFCSLQVKDEMILCLLPFLSVPLQIVFAWRRHPQFVIDLDFFRFHILLL